MYIAPVGLANAGDPDGAYAEAVDLSGAHQSSYGREAAAVLAAAVAEAVRPDATVTTRWSIRACALAHDGTRAAIDAVAVAASGLDGWRDGGLAKLRDAFAPFDSVGVRTRSRASAPASRAGCTAIEELPLAIGPARRDRRRLRRDDARRRQLRPRLRLDRIDGRRARGRARRVERGARPTGSRRSAPASRYDLEEPGRRDGRDRRVEILALDDERHARRVEAMGARRRPRTVPLEGDLDPARGPRRSRAACRHARRARTSTRSRRAGSRPAARLRLRAVRRRSPSRRELRALALELLDELAAIERPLAAQPSRRSSTRSSPRRRACRAACRSPPTSRRRVHGAWLGRAVGCLLGKPVESIPREGIRAIAQGTGNWPVRGYFTAEGLDPAVTRALAWNSASRPTSLVENIDGMPEDDDLNFTMLAVALLERDGQRLHEPRRREDLARLPAAGRIFTAERVALPQPAARPAPAARPRRTTTRSASGSAHGSASTPTAGPRRATRSAAARLAWPDARRRATRRTASTRRCSWRPRTPRRSASLSAAERGRGRARRRARARAGSPRRSASRARARRRLGGASSTRSTSATATLHWVHAINNTALVAAAMTHFTTFDEAIVRRRRGRLGHRHERRRDRLDLRRARARRRALERSAARHASRARCPASTRARSTRSRDARSPSQRPPRP